MVNGRNEQNQETESNKLPERKKDGWYKAEVLSKFLTAVLVVIITILGNNYLQKKQKSENDLSLYTQLLSNKERSENELRKDMFVQILNSFLETKKDEKLSEEKTLTKIRKMRLNLELLSRNFHESLDMKPLFKHLLMKIIRPHVALIDLLKELKKCDPNTNDNECNTENIKKFNQEARRLTNNEIEKVDTKKNSDYSNNIININKLLKNYDRELDLLVDAAKRVTRKQRDILEDVSGEMRLTVNLTGNDAGKICKEYTPLDWLPENGECKKEKDKSVSKESVNYDNSSTVEGVENSGTLWFTNSKGKKDPDSERFFSMRVRYIYPPWKQAYVEILTCPIEKNKKMTEAICERKCTENPKINKKASFWLEYFDFPLVDNTYLNGKQRYSVILDGFEEDEHGNDKKANITLLYYPSSYSGLKEKSFYNTQLMRSLLKSDLFREKTDQESKDRETPPVINSPTYQGNKAAYNREARNTGNIS